MKDTLKMGSLKVRENGLGLMGINMLGHFYFSIDMGKEYIRGLMVINMRETLYMDFLMEKGN